MEEKLLNDADASAVLSEWAVAEGRAIGVITLNVAKTLNSLTLEMIDLMDPQLRTWSADDRIVAIYLRGAGDRAFCAGGDIQALYHSMRANHEAGALVDLYAESFFEREYRLDHLLHTYPKPVVCFGNGVVMGGGLGLLSASSHRIVTETSRVAMPEITIGLFPDAGGTHLLASMPGQEGLFLGLTGAQINGADALETGLGTHLIEASRRDDVEAKLREIWFTGEPRRDRESITDALLEFDAESGHVRPDSKISEHRGAIDRALNGVSGDFAAAVSGIRSLQGIDDWIDRGLSNLEKGCPVTAGIVVEQLHRAPDLALADRFRMEMVIGTHCARNRDFAEGVRALLIDKDQNPAWSTQGGLDGLDPAAVSSHFEPPWDASPLADLVD